MNVNTSLYFQSYSLTKWLSLRLGVLTAFFAALVAVAGILVSPVNTDVASYIGVVVSNGQAISASLLNFATTLVQSEGEMASVERVIEYTELEQEGGCHKKAKRGWPRQDG